MSIVMFSSAVPGAPAIATPPEVFQELLQVGQRPLNGNNPLVLLVHADRQ